MKTLVSHGVVPNLLLENPTVSPEIGVCSPASNPTNNADFPWKLYFS
jgi:hypothetical protein